MNVDGRPQKRGLSGSSALRAQVDQADQGLVLSATCSGLADLSHRHVQSTSTEVHICFLDFTGLQKPEHQHMPRRPFPGLGAECP